MGSEILWFGEVRRGDTARVGGKNASLGEMVASLGEAGVVVPDGFATTAECYRRFLRHNELEERLEEVLGALHREELSLGEAGSQLRELVLSGEFPEDTKESILGAYRELSDRYGEGEVDVAVRSSATAEDLPEASFAGQQESFLNVKGEEELLQTCRRCFASLFTDRAISYREQKGFDHMSVALSVGVQKMVRSDLSCAGVAFTLDPETGFPDVVVINGAWGLGELVVQGTVSPDEFEVYVPLLREGKRPVISRKRGGKSEKMVYGGDGAATEVVETSREEQDRWVLTDEEVVRLAGWCAAIEEHYGCPMDIEWAKDGESVELFVVQARPETVESRKAAGQLTTYRLEETSEVLVSGTSIGTAIAAGKACLLESPEEAERFEYGAILVTRVTHPDWVPVMKRAAGIVTELGGRTSHAAIVSRELGVPAVVGARGAMDAVKEGQGITLSCAGGDQGKVFDGELSFRREEMDLSELPEVKTPVMANMANPAAAFQWWRLPMAGVGLARMEFIIEHLIKVHPMAVASPSAVSEEVREEIEALTRGYSDGREYFVDRLSRGIARIAAAFYPRPVVVRTSDFKTNEYARLLGGEEFEPKEENPMLGFRGASRYDSDLYREGFALECAALKRVREEMGFSNVIVMLPFVRTLGEADGALAVMARNGLKRGEEGLKVYMMCEIPSNVVLAAEFAERFDGFSIGSNDLTQLVLGIDRDSSLLSASFDERDPAVERTIEGFIEAAHRAGRPVGICGQAPGDHPETAAFLVRCGIDSLSINPDGYAQVVAAVSQAEKSPS